jgi:uncharacterized short protein YbdD (DUF466 family)
MAAPGVRQFLSAGFSLLRGVTGDDAYDRYIEHHERTHGDTLAPMTRQEFFKAQLENRWNCVSGCC